MDVMLVITLLTMEGEKDEAEHVEGREKGCKQANYIQRMPATFALVRFEQNGILAEESSERREAGDGERGREHGPVKDFDFLAEAAHVAHVLFAAHGMNYGTGCEEEQRFEESVSHQMEDACAKRADAAAEEHIAELRDGGISENLFDIALHEADGGGEESGGAADCSDDDQSGLRVREENVRASDDVYACRDHRSGVDQSADGRWAFHGIRQPNVKRKLR